MLSRYAQRFDVALRRGRTCRADGQLSEQARSWQSHGWWRL